MYCTICEVAIDDVSHYKSEIHGINARRKLLRYPPLVLEELDQYSNSEDLSLDINYSMIPGSFSVTIPPVCDKKVKKCLFCNEDESIRHYRDHGFDNSQSYYLSVTRCCVCFERFVDRDMLLKHLAQESHRTAFTDGVSLFLRNGKILNPNKVLMPVKGSGFWIGNAGTYKKLQKTIFQEKIDEDEKNTDVVNQL